MNVISLLTKSELFAGVDSATLERLKGEVIGGNGFQRLNASEAPHTRRFIEERWPRDSYDANR